MIIFCIPILRYVIYTATENEMEEGSNMVTMSIMPILYAFVTMHILAVYDFSYWLGLAVLLIPTLIYYSCIVATHVLPNNHNRFFTTMCFYILPFFFAVNYTFDFSKPATKRYYLIDNHELTSTDNSSEGIDVHNYYFDLVPAPKAIEPAKWVEVSEQIHNNFSGIYKHKFATSGNEHYRIFDKKKVTDTIRRRFISSGYPPGTRLRYYFLMQKDLNYERRKMKWKVFKRFKQGDYVFIETHGGLFGIDWLTYR
ncbi:hypothetical protein O0955_16345 [Pedobacter sp. HCMS5-2]|uniref:Uncharacterized protein n=1 Tax=Pedobacter punctiformis TaxID=3004097 RepID=A0ABT4LCD4_9SPHI|nr:hypothetical protein [Pedobacter sp. HCMS5-2]